MGAMIPMREIHQIEMFILEGRRWLCTGDFVWWSKSRDPVGTVSFRRRNESFTANGVDVRDCDIYDKSKG